MNPQSLRLTIVAVKVFAAWAWLCGKLAPGQYRRLRLLLRQNPSRDGVTFQQMLASVLLEEACDAGVCRESPEGPVVDSLIQLLNWLIQNADQILELVLKIIDLFT